MLCLFGHRIDIEIILALLVSAAGRESTTTHLALLVPAARSEGTALLTLLIPAAGREGTALLPLSTSAREGDGVARLALGRDLDGHGVEIEAVLASVNLDRLERFAYHELSRFQSALVYARYSKGLTGSGVIWSKATGAARAWVEMNAARATTCARRSIMNKKCVFRNQLVSLIERKAAQRLEEQRG